MTDEQKDPGAEKGPATQKTTEDSVSVAGANRRAWAAISVAFVALFVVVVGLFNWYHKRLIADLEDHYARAAARMGQEIELRYRNYSQVVASLAGETSPASPGHDASSVPVLLPSRKETVERCEKQAGSQSDKNVCAARAIAYATGALEEGQERGFNIVPCQEDLGDRPAEALLDPSRTRLVFRPDGRAPTVCGEAPIDKLLSRQTDKPTSADPSELGRAFDAVLLLSRDGTVLSSSRSTLRVMELPGFEAKHTKASTSLANVDLGTMKYRAFLQPIRAHVRSSAAKGAAEADPAGADLVLCGLVAESRLLDDSYKVEPSSFLWAVLLVGFGVLSLPLAKLWLLGQKARYTRFDVALLVTSAGAATLLGAIFCFVIVAHNRLCKRFDDQLEHVAKELSLRVSQDLTDSAKALDRLEATTGALRSALLDAGSTKEPGAAVAEACPPGIVLHQFSRDQVWPICEQTGQEFLGPQVDGSAENPYGHSWRAFWANRLGYQQIKLTANSLATSPVGIADRTYFRRARAREVSCLDPACKERGVVDVVRSVTTGKIVLIAARPTEADRDARIETPPTGVISVETDLPEFQDLVLPLGFQIAVIDSSGKVLLHSDNDAHQGLTLFDGLDSTSELKAMMAARIDGATSFRYLGAPSHVQMKYVPGASWFVLAMAPRSLIDLATTDMVLVTMLGFACLLVVALLVGWLWYAIHFVSARRHDALSGSSRVSMGLRPNSRHPRAYAAAGLSMMGWSTLICFMAWETTPWVPTSFWLVVAFAIVASSCLFLARVNSVLRTSTAINKWASRVEFFFTSLALRLRRGDREPRPWTSFLPLTYALCCFGLANVLIVTPAAVLFLGAYEYTVDGLVRAEQDHYAREVVPGRYPAGCLSSARGDALLAPTLSQPCPKVLWSGEEDAGHARSWEGLSASCLLWPVPCIVQWFPSLNSPHSQATGFLARRGPTPEAHAGEWQWTRASTELELELATATGPKEIASRLPRLGDLGYQWRHLALFALLFVTFLSIVHWVSFQSMRRLFFLDTLTELGRERRVTNKTLLLTGNEDEDDRRLAELWSGCQSDEQCLLAQLAIDGYACPHPSSAPILKRLALRGLLDPHTLTLPSRFAEFVRDHVSAQQLQVLSASDTISVWSMVKVPLSTGLAVLLLIVGRSEPELAATGALVPTLAAGLPLTLRILATIASPKKT